jgi:putative oxidoreductase
MHLIQSLIAFLGRALLSIIFIASGIHKILNWQATEQYYNQGLTDWLTLSVGDPGLQNMIEFGLSNAFFLLLLAVILETVGGVLVFLGIWVRLGAVFLMIFLVPVTFAFHHFWQIEGPDRQMQMINFMKNVSIFGGLLLLLAFGKGRKSEKKHAEED